MNRKTGRREVRRDGEASQSVLQDRLSEVHEQSSLQACQSQVGEELRLMDGQEPIDALDLDDESSLDDKVETVAAVELRALVFERHGSLALEPKPQEREFLSHTVLIRGLEQPGS
jgi:hypothetical protein